MTYKKQGYNKKVKLFGGRFSFEFKKGLWHTQTEGYRKVEMTLGKTD